MAPRRAEAVTSTAFSNNGQSSSRANGTSSREPNGTVRRVAYRRGTGLRPFLARLTPQEQPIFLDRYKALLADAFPPRADGKVLLPYPRLFFIATPQRAGEP